jgi:hypothetical protein
MKVALTALVAALTVTSAGHAQTAAPVIAPIAASPSGSAMLRTGTKVPLKLGEELTTKGKKLRVGQRINLEVAEAVLVDGQTVVPAGSPAMGEITFVKNKGMWGKSGRFTAQLTHLTVGGRQVRLTGTFDDKGTTGTAGVVGAVALLPIAGFFMTGTSAHLPVGAPVTGFIGEDVPLNFAAVEPAPMTVPVSTPLAVTPVK